MYFIFMGFLMVLMTHPYVGTILASLSGPKAWTLGSGKTSLSWQRSSLKLRIDRDGTSRACGLHAGLCFVLLYGGDDLSWVAENPPNIPLLLGGGQHF